MPAQLMYRPLPEFLTIAPSTIHKLGLFTEEDLEQGTNLGMSHLKFGEEIIRTPLGGFINHSNDPNCVKAQLKYTNQDDPHLKFDYMRWNLIVSKDVKKGEELTVRYTFYHL
jgi:hypothetical protein